MIITRKVFDEDGKMISETATCDCRPAWTWTEFVIGVCGAIIILILIGG